DRSAIMWRTIVPKAGGKFAGHNVGTGLAEAPASVRSPGMTTQPSVLLQERQGAVLVLTLNRPDQYNALSEALLTALEDTLAVAGQDESLQCVVLAASGKAFCAGHDLKQMRSRPDRNYYQDLFSQCGRVMQAIVDFPVPVIARVQGMATAAGC